MTAATHFPPFRMQKHLKHPIGQKQFNVFLFFKQTWTDCIRCIAFLRAFSSFSLALLSSSCACSFAAASCSCLSRIEVETSFQGSSKLVGSRCSVSGGQNTMKQLNHDLHCVTKYSEATRHSRLPRDARTKKIQMIAIVKTKTKTKT